WSVCFSCAEVPTQPLPPTGQETGIDVGLKVFLITAEGAAVENLWHYRKAEQSLVWPQPTNGSPRPQKGSKRREKARKVLAKRHQKVRRQRQDFHHKAALAVVRQYDVRYLEDLRVTNLVRNRHLGKNISDQAGGSSAPPLPARQRAPVCKSCW